MANVEGSIYRVENGVAVPYANLTDGGSDELANLEDVQITSPTAGQGLLYDATSQKWINGSAGGGGVDVDMGVNVTSSINFESTTIGQSVSFTGSIGLGAFLYRFGRLSQLHITMRTTADLALNDCIASAIFNVTDSTGKLTPVYSDSVDSAIGTVYVASSASSYAKFYAIPIYSVYSNVPKLMLTRDYNIEIQNASAGVKSGASVYIDLLFLNNYEG